MRGAKQGGAETPEWLPAILTPALPCRGRHVASWRTDGVGVQLLDGGECSLHSCWQTIATLLPMTGLPSGAR